MYKRKTSHWYRVWITCLSFLMIIGFGGCVNPETRSITIDFNTYGIANYNSLVYIEGSSIQIPEPDDVDGYSFGGWFFDDAYEIPFSISKLNEYLSNQNITIYAKWIYTISFVSESGSDLQPISVVYPNRIQEPNIPTRLGFSFDGWFVDENYQIPFDFMNYEVKSTLIYVKWLIQSYMITFDERFGNTVDNVIVDYGQTLTLPSPERLGYTFMGWYLDPLTMSKIFNASSMPAQNIDLYAKWIPSSDNFDVTTFFIDPQNITDEHISLDFVIDVIDEIIIGIDFVITYDPQSLLIEELTNNMSSICILDEPGIIHCIFLNIDAPLEERHTIFSMQLSIISTENLDIHIDVFELLGIDVQDNIYISNFDIFDYLYPIVTSR